MYWSLGAIKLHHSSWMLSGQQTTMYHSDNYHNRTVQIWAPETWSLEIQRPNGERIFRIGKLSGQFSEGFFEHLIQDRKNSSQSGKFFHHWKSCNNLVCTQNLRTSPISNFPRNFLSSIYTHFHYFGLNVLFKFSRLALQAGILVSEFEHTHRAAVQVISYRKSLSCELDFTANFPLSF